MFVDDHQSILTSKLTHVKKSGLQRTTILRKPESPINYPGKVSYNNHNCQRPKHQVISKKDICCSGVHLHCLRDICSGQCPGGNKGGMAESVASTKTGKNGERRNPTDNYLGRLGSFEDIFQTLDLIIFAV